MLTSPFVRHAQTLHVRYVADGNATGSNDPGIVIGEVFNTPLGIVIVAAVLIGLLLYGIIVPRLKGWGPFRLALDDTLEGYTLKYLPWVLRLSTGIPLMGAALGGYWFAAHLDGLPVRGFFSIVLLASGFFLLVGLAVRLWAIAAVIVWAYALGVHGLDVLMTAELVVALIALTAISAGRPSVDDILARTTPSAPKGFQGAKALRPVFGPEPSADVSHALHTWVPFVLRFGLGISMLYAGLVEKLMDPAPAAAVATEYGLAVGPIDVATVVVVAGIIEVFLGMALIIGFATRAFAVLTFVMLTLTLFALPDDPVMGHVSLWGVASAVFMLGGGPWSVDAKTAEERIRLQDEARRAERRRIREQGQGAPPPASRAEDREEEAGRA